MTYRDLLPILESISKEKESNVLSFEEVLESTKLSEATLNSLLEELEAKGKIKRLKWSGGKHPYKKPFYVFNLLS